MDERLHKHGRFFDVWSKFYRNNLFGRELRRIQKMAIERLRVVPGQVVLDLGCGPGDGAALLADAGAVAIGLDYSQGMIDSAKKESRLGGRLLRGDAGRLPFKDGAFDKIVCTNSFHHYPDHFKALCEMRRVLKPGGLLVLVDPRRDHLFGWAAIDLIENAVFGLEEVRIFSLTQWCQLLGEAGFSEYRATPGSVFRPVERAEVFIEARA